MLKLVYCLRRKPDMSLEEFQKYWREVHYADEVGAARRRAGRDPRGQALASEDAAVQQAAADLLEDEGNFIDLVRSPLWIAEENVVIA
jgi:hypothetical protein